MQPEPQVAIGIDIGGRGAKIALVRNDGAILHREPCPLHAELTAGAIVDAIAEAVAATDAVAGEQGLDPIGAGVAMPGYLDTDQQKVELSANLPNLTGTRFPEILAAAVPMDIQIETDGNAATLGEYHYGAGKGVQRLLVVTIGTGIGGGVMIDGKLLRIRNHNAGSIGQLVLNPDGPRGPAGACGTFEAYACAAAFEQGGRTLAELAEAARTRDNVALAWIHERAKWIAAGLASCTAIYAPQRILLGGGVASALGESLLTAVRQQFQAIGQPYAVQHTTIDLAALGNDAGAIGAASLWFDATQPHEM